MSEKVTPAGAAGAPAVAAPEELRIALAAMVAERGEATACAALQLSRSSLMRALAGRPVRRGTIALIEIGLQRLQAEAK